jgi:hypothetical protein
VVDTGSWVVTGKIWAAMYSLDSGRKGAAWRLLDEASDMMRPMLAGKDSFTLNALLELSAHRGFDRHPDLFRSIWKHISKMSSAVLGQNHPIATACRAIACVNAKDQVYEAPSRQMLSTFEERFGADNENTLQAKSTHIDSLLRCGNLEEVERLQHLLIPECERLKGGDSPDVVYELYRLGRMQKRKKKLIEAEEIFRAAMQRGRRSSGSHYPTETDIYVVDSLASVLGRRSNTARASVC